MKSEKNGNIVKKHENGLVKNEKMVYSCLDLQPKHLEQIVTESGLPAGECMAVLLKLELEGFASRRQTSIMLGNLSRSWLWLKIW